MASVLSGWCYGYNIFNIANFIEYHDHHQQQQQPLPKRRKLVDNNAAYRAVDHLVHHGHQYGHQQQQQQHQEAVLGRKKAGSGGGHMQQHQTINSITGSCPIYRPFSINSGRGGAVDKTTSINNSKSSKQLSDKQQQQQQLAAEALALAAAEAESSSSNSDGGRTTMDNIFPELLCLIFQQLDLQSKGRAAQVLLKKHCLFSLFFLHVVEIFFFLWHVEGKSEILVPRFSLKKK